MASGFGELVLVVGDSHIPHRAASIPEKFQKMLVPGKIQHVLCTGNMICKEQYDELRALSSNIHIVSGDCDDESSFSESKIVTIGQFRIGLMHGHQIIPWGDPMSLSAVQRKMNVDILVTGHTHHIHTKEGKWYLDPGSITGAMKGGLKETIPSFVLLAVQGAKVVAFVYELKNDNVVVSKSEYKKST
ncbi:unnamed protein product [Albugo candida]|uniref:Vacuolar protein sorting-associated protein 29 n=1 Tax=Albugo candida TaxID=65357 RepID=A0A024GQG2_9STRA|nr:unnamed protein product [Albugo candida]|eukprot:CCI48796.1 unnamed protein product [Albugo candida]